MRNLFEEIGKIIMESLDNCTDESENLYMQGQRLYNLGVKLHDADMIANGCRKMEHAQAEELRIIEDSAPDDWKPIEIFNLPHDILVGDYEFKIISSITSFKHDRSPVEVTAPVSLLLRDIKDGLLHVHYRKFRIKPEEPEPVDSKNRQFIIDTVNEAKKTGEISS